MKKVVKQVVAFDVAQNELVVTLGRVYDDVSQELVASKTFANRQGGFKALLLWIKRFFDAELQTLYVMEATGVYHESLAYFLDDQGFWVSIVLPNKISSYMRTLQVKTITDKTASQAICSFGMDRKLPRWKRPVDTYKKLRQLTRERHQIVDQRTVALNQMHAQKAQAEPCPSSLQRTKKLIEFLSRQEKQIIVEITELVKQGGEVKRAVGLISSITGVGELTAATVLGETNGFDLIKSKKQLTSYAGLDVVEKQSGTSVKGKAKISKRGNKYLRRAMHLPALTAIGHDERFKALFARVVAKHGIKMKAVVAVQRKLLEMTYTIFKTGMSYDKQYLQKQQNTQAEQIIKAIN